MKGSRPLSRQKTGGGYGIYAHGLDAGKLRIRPFAGPSARFYCSGV